MVQVILRSGAFHTIERHRVVRLGERKAEDTTLFSGDLRRKRLRISKRSYPGQFSVKQSIKIYNHKSKKEYQKQYLANLEKVFFF